MKRKLLWALGLVAGTTLVTLFVGPEIWQKSSHESATPSAVPAAVRAARDVYPFSVIPGGVVSASEVAQSAAVDPVVARHYAGVRVNKLVPARVQTPMQAYVSFRKGNRVYWTNRKVPIRKGEMILTDGANMIRGRCGNRIALLPPTTAMDEGPSEAPPEVAMETPIPSPLEPPEFAPPAPFASSSTAVPRPPEPKIAVSRPPAWGGPPLLCCSSNPPRENPPDNPPDGPEPTPTPVPTPTPPVAVPEPGIVGLLVSGLALLSAGALFTNKRKRN